MAGGASGCVDHGPGVSLSSRVGSLRRLLCQARRGARKQEQDRQDRQDPRPAEGAIRHGRPSADGCHGYLDLQHHEHAHRYRTPVGNGFMVRILRCGPDPIVVRSYARPGSPVREPFLLDNGRDKDLVQ